MRAIVRPARERTKAHSQMRRTVQPEARSARVTVRSRSAFRASFAAHHAARVTGLVAWRGQPCQKQPSTNTATFSARKMKSGLPGSGAPRRQPVMPCSRISAMRRSSVARFPLERMSAMTALRFAGVKTSAIGALAIVGGDLETPGGFVILVRVHPIVEPGPLRIARVEFLVGKFARVSPPPRLCGEALQRARPAALGVLVSVGMQTGEGVGDGTSCADEGTLAISAVPGRSANNES